MAHNVIAVVADCDDTLAPDTTGQLLTASGLDPARFFAERSATLVRQGWDPALAYLHEILEADRNGEMPQLTKDRILEIGREVTFYPGLPDAFASLRSEIEEDPDYRGYGIQVEFYVISSGIEDLIAQA